MTNSGDNSGKGRLLVVSSHFPPRQAAGVYRTLRFVRYLSELGWNIDVLTVDPASYEADAKSDDGLLDKVPTSVTVHRTKATYPLQSLNRVRRIISWNGKPSVQTARSECKETISTNVSTNGSNGISTVPPSRGIWQRLKDAVTVPLMTPDRMIGWIRFAVRCGKQVIRTKGVDAIYSSGPPWSNHLVGLKLHQSTRRFWIADFRDPWVGNDFRENRRGDSWSGRKHRQLEREVVNAASYVVVNTDRSRQEMVYRYPTIPVENFVVIPNGFDPDDFNSNSSVAATAEMKSQKLVIAHAGFFYGKRNIDGFLQALGNVCRDGRLPSKKVSVQLIGAHTNGRRSRELDAITIAGLNGVVELLPSVPHDECLERMSQADVLLLVQTDAPLCVPGKLFEYIALRKPVFTLAGHGATADLVTEEKLGPCLVPNDIEGIERALLEVYERWSTRGYYVDINDSARERYNGRRLTEQLDWLLCKHREAGSHVGHV